VIPSTERRDRLPVAIERRYTSIATFLRACRHYRTVGRRILAYMRHAEGWGLILESKP
jgi:hypothetical protein